MAQHNKHQEDSDTEMVWLAGIACANHFESDFDNGTLSKVKRILNNSVKRVRSLFNKRVTIHKSG